MSDRGGETDPRRPQPQYGEYATPEQQRASIRLPESAPAPPPAVPTPAAAVPPRTSRGPLVDRVATIALLTYGLLNVITAAPLMFALARGRDGYLGLLGMDEPLADTASAQLWGAIAGSVFIAGWLVTALLSWRRLRRGRISFWVPLVGAVATGFVSAALILTPAIADPAFQEFLTTFSGLPR